MSTDAELLDRLADAVFAVDDRWRFTYLNDRASRMFERDPDDLLGRVIWDEFPETVETQFPDGFYQAMETQDPVAFEVYHTPLDTWFEARAFPSEDGITVYMLDVTDRKQRRRELARYESVVEAAYDGVVAIDAKNRIASVNEAVERTLGVDREQLIGEHIEAIADVAEIDADALGDMGHAIDALTAGNADVRQFEVPYTDRHNRDRVAEMRMVRLEDATSSVVGVVRDITERHRHEQVVQHLHDVSRRLFGARDRIEICSIVVQATSDILGMNICGVWLLDDEMGRLDPIAGSSGAYDELGGLPRFNEGEGLVWDVFRRDAAALYEDVHDHEGVYNDDSPIRSEIIVPMGSHGVLMTGALEVGAFDETDLELVSTLAANAEAALDRADRDRLLRDRKETLERQSERLEAVSTVISTDVADRLEGATEAADDEAARREIEAASELLDDVLEFAGGRTGVGPRSAVRISEAAGRASDRVGAATVSIDDDAELRADEERFVRLFSALFESAAERAEDEVAVTVDVLDGERGFRVEDDAPDDVAESNPFDVTDDSPGGSAGLGLAVAREIANAHGWEIDLESTDDGVAVTVSAVTTLEPARTH